MKIKYVEMSLQPATLELVNAANTIIAEYEAAGFDLTLRQLYYQFVARDLLPNTERSYKRLGSVVNDARLAGLIDWDSISDRTRYLRSESHWESPAEIIGACATQFRVDLWKDQNVRPEVWIEKDALVGVIEGVCKELDVPYFSCRGYTSQSEMWRAAMRLAGHAKKGQSPVVLHLGDHDPSGIDMSRDIEERIRLFLGRRAHHLDFRRLALNFSQIEEYNPPPNPAKVTDSRYESYAREYGTESWELDSMDPRAIALLVREAIGGLLDDTEWARAMKRQDRMKAQLQTLSDNWVDDEDEDEEEPEE